MGDDSFGALRLCDAYRGDGGGRRAGLRKPRSFVQYGAYGGRGPNASAGGAFGAPEVPVVRA